MKVAKNTKNGENLKNGIKTVGEMMEFNEIWGGGSCKNLILVLIFSKLTSHHVFTIL